jgi:hypothetical protein
MATKTRRTRYVVGWACCSSGGGELHAVTNNKGYRLSFMTTTQSDMLQASEARQLYEQIIQKGKTKHKKISQDFLE